MTEAADTRGTVPTASVLARGASRESSIPLAAGVTSGLIARSQALGCKQRACIDYQLHRNPTKAAKAIPAAMMITRGQSISSRSSFMQAALDVLAVLFGAFLILLLALCVAAAPLFLLFLFLMFV